MRRVRSSRRLAPRGCSTRARLGRVSYDACATLVDVTRARAGDDSRETPRRNRGFPLRDGRPVVDVDRLDRDEVPSRGEYLRAPGEKSYGRELAPAHFRLTDLSRYFLRGRRTKCNWQRYGRPISPELTNDFGFLRRDKN